MNRSHIDHFNTSSCWARHGLTFALRRAIGVGMLAAAGLASAQVGAPTVAASKPAPSSSKSSGELTLKSAFVDTSWVSLSAEQRRALTPLATAWGSLSEPQKRKWISLSSNFAQMTPVNQGKLHTRMAQWAALSPQQRELARLNFAEAARVAPAEKSEKWQAYQALSAEEKQKLAKSAIAPPPRTALAAKPTPPDRLSPIVVKRSASSPKPPVSSPATTRLTPAPAMAASAATAASTSSGALALPAAAASVVTPALQPASTASQ